MEDYTPEADIDRKCPIGLDQINRDELAVLLLCKHEFIFFKQWYSSGYMLWLKEIPPHDFLYYATNEAGDRIAVYTSGEKEPFVFKSPLCRTPVKACHYNFTQ